MMANSALGKFFARPRPAVDWAVVPATTREIDAVVRYCRRLVSQRALMAAGVAVVPLPGIDWVTDVAVLMKLIPDINHAFGLTPEQIERLAPDRQVVVYKAISAGGGLLIGRLVTRELVMGVLRLVGVRLTTQQAAKFVPIAGQARLGRAHLLGAALRVRAAHPAVRRHLAPVDAACAEPGRRVALKAAPRTVASTIARIRGVAQPGSATGLGPVGREFESRRPDQTVVNDGTRCP